VKNTVINNGSELSPKFFTTPEERHPDGDFSHFSRNARESITAGDTNTRLTTPLPHASHTDTDNGYK